MFEEINFDIKKTREINKLDQQEIAKRISDLSSSNDQDIDFILTVIATALHHGFTLEPELSKYLSVALFNTIHSKEPRKSFGYKLRQRQRVTGQKNELKYLHWALVEAEMSNGAKVTAARKIVTKQMGIPFETIKRHHLEYQKENPEHVYSKDELSWLKDLLLT